MKRLALVTAALGAISAASTASACPEFNLVAQPIAAEGYSPNSPSPVALQIEFYLLDGPADPSCASHIIELRSQTAQGVRDLRNLGSSAVISGAIPPNQTVFASYTDTTIRLSQPAVQRLVSTGRLVFDYSWLPAGTYYPAGLYTNEIDVVVNGFQATTVDPEVTVFPAMRLLGDFASGYGNIDFGELESYEEATARFIYQSNARLTVTAQSMNGGNLVHEDGAAVYTVPYSTFVNDNNISLDGAQALALTTNANNQTMGSLRLRLGDIGTPVAGDYSDILTLSFTAE